MGIRVSVPELLTTFAYQRWVIIQSVLFLNHYTSHLQWLHIFKYHSNTDFKQRTESLICYIALLIGALALTVTTERL